jgi:hypothetical protein
MPRSPNPATSRALYFRLLSYVRPYWRMFALSLFGLAFSILIARPRKAVFSPHSPHKSYHQFGARGSKGRDRGLESRLQWVAGQLDRLR